MEALALAGVTQCVERGPANQRVLIRSQGGRPGPQYQACERQPHVDVSLPHFLPPFPSV